MKRLLIITLLALAVPCAAQRPPVVFPRGLEGESASFTAFRQKLDSLVHWGTGDVRVLHVGGSHVQGGTWSDRLRTRFLS